MPWLTLIAPPGLPYPIWRHQIAFLGRAFRLLTWDLRGLDGNVDTAAGSKRGAHVIDARGHLEDFQAAADIVGAARTAVVGWGLGAQIALDIAQRAPDQISHLVAIGSRLTATFTRSLGLDESALKLPDFASGACAYATPFAPGLNAIFRPSASTLHRLNIVSPTLDDELYAEVNRALAKTDRRALARVIGGLESQRSDTPYDSVRTPSLWISGDIGAEHDRITARRLARRMPFGEFVQVEAGSFLLPLEYPELINLKIERFVLPARKFGVEAEAP